MLKAPKLKKKTLESESGAAFSKCLRYRYRLWRIWDKSLPVMVFCMLNPSTADESVNDPTIARCQERARRLGFGGIEVINLFAWRSPDPKELYSVLDPVGPDNDKYIKAAINQSSVVLCGWGKHGILHERHNHILGLIKMSSSHAYILKINNDGSPRHPLYVGYRIKPKKWQVLSR